MKFFQRKKESSLAKKLLENEDIHINKLRVTIYQNGIVPEEEEVIRGDVWKLFLNFYPPQRSQWDKIDILLHKDYLTFLSDFFPAEKQTVTENTKEMDTLLLYEIDKDVNRLFPKESFFVNEKNKEAIRHILYVQTKFNKTCPYVQGMNDIAGILFYAFSQSLPKERAESTAYYCFAYLMTRISDWFSPKHDNTPRGIHAQLDRIDKIMEMKEPEIYEHLQKVNINNTLYLFRWVTLLFAQEFPIDKVLLIWDCILCDSTNDFICCFAVSMVAEIKKQLLSSDFSGCLKLLQKYPSSIDVHTILKRARLYYADRMNFPRPSSPTTFQSPK